MKDLFTRIFYGAPEVFFRQLRFMKAPLLLVGATILGLSVFSVIPLLVASRLTHDSGWIGVLFLAPQCAQFFFLDQSAKLAGDTQNAQVAAARDALYAASAHFTPLQSNVLDWMQWGFTIVPLLLLGALVWMGWRNAQLSKHKTGC